MGWGRPDKGGNQLGSCSVPLGERDNVLAALLGGERAKYNRREVQSRGLGGFGLQGEGNSRKCPYFWLLCLLAVSFIQISSIRWEVGIREDTRALNTLSLRNL